MDYCNNVKVGKVLYIKVKRTSNQEPRARSQEQSWSITEISTQAGNQEPRQKSKEPRSKYHDKRHDNVWCTYWTMCPAFSPWVLCVFDTQVFSLCCYVSSFQD